MQKWKNPTSLYRLLCNMLRISDFERAHRLPQKEIAKIFVTGLNLTYSVKKSTQEVVRRMNESRAELSTYRDILEITDRLKKADVKKEKRDPPYSHGVARKTADTKASGGSDPSISKKTRKLGQCSRYEEWGVLSMPQQEGYPLCE